MTNNLLLEIGVEELPGPFVDIGLEKISAALMDMLKNQRIVFDKIVRFGTAQRLAFIVYSVETRQRAEQKTVKGPPFEIAFSSGKITTAGLKFLDKFGLRQSDIIQIDTEKGRYIGACLVSKRLKTVDILKEQIPAILSNIQFPKNMQWGTGITFARPIKRLCCLFGNTAVPFRFSALTAGNQSRGHRFLAPEVFTLGSAGDYESELSTKFVVVDGAKRRQRMLSQANSLLKTGEKLQTDDNLLRILTNSNEYPTAFMGRFNKEYLALPAQLISLVLKKQQFLIPICFDGKITNEFVGFRDGNERNIDVVRAGTERVVYARLADALFFYKSDMKYELSYYTERLKGVILEKRLGTIFDKVQRLKKLTPHFANALGVMAINDCIRAASICKNDLVTDLVTEFTELQGIIGREYAKKCGETDNVAEAISEHYLPRFRGDVLPQTPAGIVLSLVDKFDNIIAFFGIGAGADGSKDPYSLRRQALGIIRILLENKLRIKISDLINKTLDEFPLFEKSLSETVHGFILQRFIFFLREKGFGYDVIDSVMAVEQEDIVLIFKKIEALRDLKKKPAHREVAIAFSRATNILKQGEPASRVEESLFSLPAEWKLYDKVKSIEQRFKKALAAEDFSEIIKLMLEVKPDIDNFFDTVFVNVKDERVKANRLALMRRISELFLKFADFTKLVEN